MSRLGDASMVARAFASADHHKAAGRLILNQVDCIFCTRFRAYSDYFPHDYVFEAKPHSQDNRVRDDL